MNMVEAPISKEISPAQDLFRRAQNLRDSGNPRQALPLYSKAIQLASFEESIDILAQKGVAFAEARDYEAALAIFVEVIKDYREAGNREGYGNCMRDMATTHLAMGQAEAAAGMAATSQELLLGTKAKEDPGGVALSLAVEAAALASLGEAGEAEDKFKEAIGLAQEAKDKNEGETWWPISTVLTYQARFLYRQGRFAEATEVCQQALAATLSGIETDRLAGKETRQDKRLAGLNFLLSEAARRMGKADLDREALNKYLEYSPGLSVESAQDIFSWVKKPSVA